MKTIWKAALAGILVTGGLFAQSIVGRELHQQERIGQGVGSGALTRGEAHLITENARQYLKIVQDYRAGL